MSEEKTLEQKLADKLAFIEQIEQERNASTKIKKLESEWTTDSAKKIVWENGLGEALKKNPMKAEDADWLEAQMELATLRYQSSIKKEPERKVVDDQTLISAPEQPANAAPKTQEERDKPLDFRQMSEKEIAKKFGMTEGQAIMAKIFGPKHLEIVNRKK